MPYLHDALLLLLLLLTVLLLLLLCRCSMPLFRC
jgi:hypothetical protein